VPITCDKKERNMHSEAQEVAENCLGAPELPTTHWKSYAPYICMKNE